MTKDLMRYLLPLTAGVALIAQASTTAASDLADRQGKPRKILLDTDPGGDDAFALFWLQSLAKQGRAEIVAVNYDGGERGVGVPQRLEFALERRLGGFARLVVFCNLDGLATCFDGFRRLRWFAHGVTTGA